MGLIEVDDASRDETRRLTSSMAAMALLVGAALISQSAAAPRSAAAQLPAIELLPPRILIADGPSGGVELLDVPIPGLEDLLRVGASGSDKQNRAESGSCNIIGQDEKRFARKVNRVRKRRNIRNVKLDKEISAVAGAHSRAMRRRNDLHHTPDRKLRDRVTRWVLLGENVGQGTDVDSLHRAFMASDTHRRATLHKRFVHVGVGIARDQDRIWMTVLFESRNDPGTRMKLPEGC